MCGNTKYGKNDNIQSKDYSFYEQTISCIYSGIDLVTLFLYHICFKIFSPFSYGYIHFTKIMCNIIAKTV